MESKVIDDGLHYPTCKENIKPYKGKVYDSLEDAMQAYGDYGRASGFDTRIGGGTESEGLLIWRYAVCNRQGQKNAAAEDSINESGKVKKKRRTRSFRCGCEAKIVFKHITCGRYIVDRFVEGHNHELIDENHRCFMKANRVLDVIHQQFILDCAKASIGPTHAQRLMQELLGGEFGVGCTVTEIRNFIRDTKCFVDGVDAHMLLDQLKKKKEICDGFTYSYEIDKHDKLKRVFWCDAISKKNYQMFGEVVAFDTTYSINKYCMIFAPFTGQDNHGRAVKFGAGLLNKEDSDSFTWLFEQFLKAVGKAPRMITTDQDLGMRVAVTDVLKDTRHRWCMWHIMLKLADKVSKDLRANENFKKDLNRCVWSDMLEPADFDREWMDIMVEYDLLENDWFISMFEAKKYWVPAYFRDFHLGGLLRTTSISEGENSFYKRYTKSRSNLMEFCMHFNSALDAQRHSNMRMNYRDKTLVPEFKTQIAIEKHASEVYTSYIFEKMKSEIKDACFGCRLVNMSVDEEIEIYKMIDAYDREIVVTHSADAETYDCSCKLFILKGFICSTIIFILKNKGITRIPDKYISTRWKQTHLLMSAHNIKASELDVYASLEEHRRLSNSVLSAVYKYIHIFDGDCDKISKFLAIVEEGGEAISGCRDIDTATTKNKLIARFYPSQIPDSVDVHPPDVVKTKGSGSRLVSKKEARIRELNKPKRICKKCGELGHHDSRNCDKIKNKNKC